MIKRLGVQLSEIVLVLSLIWSGLAFASFPQESGMVTYLQVHKNPTDNTNTGQRYIVKLSSKISDNQCGSGDIWTGIFDTEGGRAIYSAILAASISGKNIMINGTSPTTCLSDAMLIRNVFITNQ